MSQAPDMEQAIDILKCSSLQMELNAKEKEVRAIRLSVYFSKANDPELHMESLK